MTVECYAQRLLNPLRGAVHIIRYASAEAVTTDGVQWDIYVSNDALIRDLPGDRRIQTSDIRYGSWSVDKGLKRGPINPYDDFLLMEEMGAVVYEHLTRIHDRIPFPYTDRYELWLLDREGQPLALLDSARLEREISLDQPRRWQAGHAARERFTSPALGAQDAGQTNVVDQLAEYVNACAGPSPVVQWFRREEDGAGTGMQASDAARGGRRLAASAFPPYLLATANHDAGYRQLIEDYQAWLAPWLLLLGGMDSGERRRLERLARVQATEVARQYRLYPEVIDQGEINAALVEAVLLRSQGNRAIQADNSMSTFYIELNPAGGEYL